jgi:hypothetical protein
VSARRVGIPIGSEGLISVRKCQKVFMKFRFSMWCMSVYFVCCDWLDVSSVDNIRIRFQGRVELILAPPAAIPGLVFPELMTPSGSNSSPAELMSVTWPPTGPR